MEPFEAVRVRKDGVRIDVESTVSPIVDGSGEIVAFSAISREIGGRKRAQALAADQALLLARVGGGTALPELLDLVARFVEEHAPDALASILLLDADGRHLRHGAAPSHPADYRAAIDGVEIGPAVGSCGASIHRPGTG